MPAALELLDEVGIDGLTVRALAGGLGVQASTLYWHVKNKQDVLDAMVTEVWRQIASELDAVGFCMEEQAVRQSSAAGDTGYSIESRNTRLDDRTHPLVVASSRENFGDSEARFDLVSLIIETAGALRTR